jgi:hypothetical protein
MHGAVHALPYGQARWLSVLPGTRDSVAVDLHRPEIGPQRAGLIVLDDGVPRSLDPLNQIAGARMAAGPDGYLFSFDDASSSFAFFTLAVTGSSCTTPTCSACPSRRLRKSNRSRMNRRTRWLRFLDAVVCTRAIAIATRYTAVTVGALPMPSQNRAIRTETAGHRTYANMGVVASAEMALSDTCP